MQVGDSIGIVLKFLRDGKAYRKLVEGKIKSITFNSKGKRVKVYHFYTLDADDVEPIKHGRWVCGYDLITNKHEYICNQCGYAPYYGGSIYNYKYCPNCGAKMDKEARND